MRDMLDRPPTLTHDPRLHYSPLTTLSIPPELPLARRLRACGRAPAPKQIPYLTISQAIVLLL